VTTEEVLIEFLTFFAARGPLLRQKAVLVVRGIAADSTVTVQAQSHETFRSGLDLYAARLDKGYSLTDCISMVTMRQHDSTEALTNDRHFEQEGFQAVFRTD
jgi:predicted nucleic acid-binding protein